MTKKVTLLLAFSAALAVAGTAVRADVPGPAGARTGKPVTGEQVYRAVCQACHMADAKGATGAATIPALAGNPALASPEYPLTIISTGRGAMPPLADTLTPTQIAAVVTYIRTHFGNHYPAIVTPAKAKAVIDATHVAVHAEDLP
jgi:mono/diheme cytochrome c family protein